MKRKMTGNALPIALILLLMLTILGVAGLRMAGAELKVAGAMQLFTTAFFAAESAIETSIATGTLADGMPETLDPPISIPPDVTGQATRRYLDRGPVPGGGYSIADNKYAAYHFEAQGTGTASNDTALTMMQGVYVIARGGN